MEYAAERELGWYDDDEYISWEAVDDSEEAYETVEAEEPDIYIYIYICVGIRRDHIQFHRTGLELR